LAVYIAASAPASSADNDNPPAGRMCAPTLTEMDSRTPATVIGAASSRRTSAAR
jgi:hypothetical protein